MHDMMFWGVLVSLLYAELTGISPGGIVVAGYFVLYWNDPLRILLTLGISLLCLLVVRLLSRYMILYGRRRFAVYLLTGMLLKMAFALLYAEGPAGLPNLSLSIGYLVPGLLARDAERQGIVPTFLSLGVVVCLLKLVEMLVGR